MRTLIAPLTCSLLLACGQPDGTAGDRTVNDSTSTAAAPAIDLSTHGLPLLLTPPHKQLLGGMDPTIVWKDETGTLEIRAGEHFGLVIREEPADIPRLKAALDRDLLKKNSVLRETPDLLVYRSEFPDDPDLVYLHFYQVVQAGDRSFVIEDVDDKAFNQQDVDRMLAAISTKAPA